MNRAALAALCLLASLHFAPPAHADEAGVVSVLRTRESAPWIEEATSRIAGELRAVGFRVRVVDRVAVARPVDAPGELATIAIVATPKGAEVDVWITDKVSDELRVKRVVEADRSAPNAASDLAVRSVELLRASLLQATPAQRAALAPPVAAWLAEAPSTPAPAASSAPAIGAKAPTSSPPSPRASPPAGASRSAAALAAPRIAGSLEAGVGILTGNGAGFAFAPALVRAGFVHRSGLGARVTGAEALAITRTGAAGATVSARQSLASVDATYAFGSARARVAPHVSAGGGVFVVDADGRATLPVHALHPRFATGFFDVGAGIALRLRPEIALVSDVGCLLLPTEPAVTIDGATVFRTGHPALLASLGAAAHF